MSGSFDARDGRRWRLKAGVGLLIIAVAVVGTYLLVRPKGIDHAGEVVGFSAPPTSGTVAVMPDLKAVYISGGSTGCLPTGGCGTYNYAQLLDAEERWTGTIFAIGATGYYAGLSDTPPDEYAARLSQVYAAKPDLVIVEGSTADRFFPSSSVEAAAASLLTALRTHLPTAKIIVVGPIWGGVVPAKVLATDDAVKAAAKAAATIFIDPIADGWFSGSFAALAGPDHKSPTNEGHARMASMIAKDLLPLNLRGS